MNFFHQKVNSSLAIALLALMCFWTVFHFFSSKAQIMANELSEQQKTTYESVKF